MSETTLNRRLKRKFNRSFISILLDFCLERAVELLKTDLKIQIIAEQCGFHSSSYFSKPYKSKFGKTAKNTQKEMQKRSK